MRRLKNRIWVKGILIIVFLILIWAVAVCMFDRYALPIFPGSGVHGRLMSRDDRTGLFFFNDIPIQNAFVVAIAGEQFTTLLDNVSERYYLGNNNPHNVQFTMNEELYSKYVTGSTISNSNGYYILDLPPGNYFLCLANTELQRRSKILPAFVTGCEEISVEQGRRLTQNIFWESLAPNFQ